MGGAASKATRQYPKSSKPSWAGTRAGEIPAPSQAKPPPFPKASESRTAAIEQDSKDPHLAANLRQLGAVNVDHHMKTVRPAAAQINHAFQQRLQSEQEASSSRSTHNRLLSLNLTDLLNERKDITSQEGLEKLAKKYNIDASKIESLSRFVNSPSTDQDSLKRAVGEDGVETITMKAMWVDPVFKPRLSNTSP